MLLSCSAHSLLSTTTERELRRLQEFTVYVLGKSSSVLVDQQGKQQEVRRPKMQQGKRYGNKCSMRSIKARPARVCVSKISSEDLSQSWAKTQKRIQHHPPQRNPRTMANLLRLGSSLLALAAVSSCSAFSSSRTFAKQRRRRFVDHFQSPMAARRRCMRGKIRLCCTDTFLTTPLFSSTVVSWLL